MLEPEEQRRFAAEVVRRLREAGFTAYWAGGCVRDQLLGRTPKDYDVATSAVPQEIRALFGRRRTLAIGAAFGVISVIGPKGAGTVEAATFRRDAAYSDGRHPDSVTFSSPKEDASRRDFTVNGLFYDPVERRVIDFVGGQEDLAERRLRAIGNPRDRIAEDKLRMLRAVRFATTLGFALEEKTREAVTEMAAEIHAVSPERIAAEMRRLLADPNRAAGVRLLLETGLAAEVLPEITVKDETASPSPLSHWERVRVRAGSGEALAPGPSPKERGEESCHAMLTLLDRLSPEAEFPLALAAVLAPFVDSAGAEAVCRRWRLSNKETERIVWLVEHHAALKNALAMRWSSLHPLLTADGVDDLLKLTEAASAEGALAVEHCRRLLTAPRDVRDPPPLLTGADLLALGIPAGPKFKVILAQIRTAQLDGEIRTKAEAVEKLKNEGSGQWPVVSGQKKTPTQPTDP